MTTVRWLFGDQLGPHFLDDSPDGNEQPVLLIESRKVFTRRRFHRQKAHLVLSAMRHRAQELGDRCSYVKADTYGEVLDEPPSRLGRAPRFEVCHPTSWGARDFVENRADVAVLPARGYATSMADFAEWVGGSDGRGRSRLLMEDFYRDARKRLEVLMDGSRPTGGRWNFDEENREPPPRRRRSASDPEPLTLGVPDPWWASEDEIDEEVRADLDRWEKDGDVGFVGRDGPRIFPATTDQATTALHRFIDHRLPTFGRWEDAMLAGDPWMSHSLLSSSFNLGLLDPLDAVHAAEQAHRSGAAPLAAVEGFVRQLIGWRDWMWHLYWHSGRDWSRRNALRARRGLPDWFADLDADAVEARCLSSILGEVRDHAWVHHIPRLMVLGNYAMQRGWNPAEVTDWFHTVFVDGYAWVMVANVIGMSQYADGGRIVTKPYAGGGAYIDRMSDYCGGCRYSPKVRVGENACPFTAGYWWFLNRHREAFAGNRRLLQPLRGLDRLSDLDEVIAQEDARGSSAP